MKKFLIVLSILALTYSFSFAGPLNNGPVSGGGGGGVGSTDDQVATEVPFTPAGNIAATNTQTAIQELDNEKSAITHNHTGTYEPVDATIIRLANVDDVPVDGATTAPVSSNRMYDHENAANPHSGSASTVAPDFTGGITTEDSTPRFWVCEALTGGTSGSLDNIPIASIGDKDVAVVNLTGVVYIYYFVAAATDAESSPGKIRPNDYASAGVWYQSGLGGLATLNLSSIDYFQVGGVSLNDLDMAFTVAQTFGGGIKALTPISGTAAGFAAGFTGANLYGGTYRVTTAGACGLPDPAVGMNFMIINEIADASTINPDSAGTADTIYRNGLAMAQDEDLTASAIGAMCVFQYQAANTWMAICSSTYTEATPP